jgi:hypothetical protein
MVMGTTYAPDRLVFDHVHRRSERSEAVEGEEYPREVLRCHTQFTDDMEQSMEAKVEILYGTRLQKEMVRTLDFTVLPLWGEFEGIIVLLLSMRRIIAIGTIDIGLDALC